MKYLLLLFPLICQAADWGRYESPVFVASVTVPVLRVVIPVNISNPVIISAPKPWDVWAKDVPALYLPKAKIGDFETPPNVGQNKK